jgi:hypothetical protein
MGFGTKASLDEGEAEAALLLEDRIRAIDEDLVVAGGTGRQRLFRARAEACLQSARRSKNAKEKAELVDLATGWSQLARQQAIIQARRHDG